MFLLYQMNPYPMDKNSSLKVLVRLLFIHFTTLLEVVVAVKELIVDVVVVLIVVVVAAVVEVNLVPPNQINQAQPNPKQAYQITLDHLVQDGQMPVKCLIDSICKTNLYLK